MLFTVYCLHTISDFSLYHELSAFWRETNRTEWFFDAIIMRNVLYLSAIDSIGLSIEAKMLVFNFEKKRKTRNEFGPFFLFPCRPTDTQRFLPKWSGNEISRIESGQNQQQCLIKWNYYRIVGRDERLVPTSEKSSNFGKWTPIHLEWTRIKTSAELAGNFHPKILFFPFHLQDKYLRSILSSLNKPKS